jgi:hypothetical protein
MRELIELELMPSFPLIRDLPPLLGTRGWSWKSFTPPNSFHTDFWIGTDPDGTQWVTKLSGGFCAYREIAFAKLAQSMGWSCQSSVFMRLDEESAHTLGVATGEIHAAHWFLREHAATLCSHNCDMRPLQGLRLRSVSDLNGSTVSHLMDWPKAEIANYVFGGLEPPDQLFTTAHEFVIIDSETMFASGPVEFDKDHWWCDSSIVSDVCRNICALTDAQIEDALSIPSEVTIHESWPIAPLLRAGVQFAKNH